MAEMFLEIDGIKGDSEDDGHKEWIEVDSYQHNVHQPLGGAGSAQGHHTGGRVVHEDFTVTKKLDSSSPILAIQCCEGKPIPKAKIEICRAMGDKTTFMEYDFTDLIVASVSPSGVSGGEEEGFPMEEVTFRYSSIKWSYTPTDTKGGKKAAIVHGWSTRQNKKL